MNVCCSLTHSTTEHCFCCTDIIITTSIHDREQIEQQLAELKSQEQNTYRHKDGLIRSEAKTREQNVGFI